MKNFNPFNSEANKIIRLHFDELLALNERTLIKKFDTNKNFIMPVEIEDVISVLEQFPRR